MLQAIRANATSNANAVAANRALGSPERALLPLARDADHDVAPSVRTRRLRNGRSHPSHVPNVAPSSGRASSDAAGTTPLCASSGARPARRHAQNFGRHGFAFALHGGDGQTQIRLVRTDGCHVVIGVRGERQQRTLRGAQGAIAATAFALLVALALMAGASRAVRRTSSVAWRARWRRSRQGRCRAGWHRAAPRGRPLGTRPESPPRAPRRRHDAPSPFHGRCRARAAHADRRTARSVGRKRSAVRAGSRRTATGSSTRSEQTERLGSLAEHLLTAERDRIGMDDGIVEPVRLDALAHEVAESLEPVAQEQGRRFECATPEAVTVPGRPQMLKRVLLNLVHTPLPPLRGRRACASRCARSAGPPSPR